jgi:hypothetical protein
MDPCIYNIVLNIEYIYDTKNHPASGAQSAIIMAGGCVGITI